MAVNEYSFELIKNYPGERRFLIKKQMEKPLLDAFWQAFFGKK
jgi:hypothetical protein